MDQASVNLGHCFDYSANCIILCSTGCTCIVRLSYLSCRAEQNSATTETNHEFIFCKSRAET